MLQSNPQQIDRTRLPFSLQARPDQAEGPGIGELIKLVLAFLRRQYVVIIVTVALASAATLLYLRMVRPTYVAQVQILLAGPRPQFVQQQSFLTEPQIDVPYIETQLQLVRSRATAVAAINQLKLTGDPDFKASSSWLPSVLHRIRTKEAHPPEEPQSDPPNQPSEAVIAAFLNRLSVGRIGLSHVIEASFTSSNAVRAAEIANAVASAYINEQLNAKFESGRVSTSWLQERLRKLSDDALTAERAVSAFKSQNNIVSPGGRPINEQQINDLNARQVAARAQTSDAEVKLKRYEDILQRTSPTSGAPEAIGPEVLQSQIINNLRQQYLEMTRREADWSVRYGRDHVAVVNLRGRIRDIRTSILEEVKRLAEVSRNEFEASRQRQQELEKQLAQAVSQSGVTNSAELTIRDLEGRAKSLRTLYETFLQHYMSSTQQETFPISEARVIFPAVPAQTKSKPKTIVVLAFGLLGGLALGIGLAFIRDAMDRVFRTSSQLEAALDLPCLSLVPLVTARKQQKLIARSQQADEDLNQRKISTVPEIHRAVVGMPLSRFTEAIRSIKLAIDHSPTKASNQVIGITSALPNEGKTTIAACLAQLIAHSGKRVIIVDCDLRNPSLSASVVPKAAHGIIEVANGSRTLEESTWRDPRTNLAVLPAVRRGSLIHTSELLSAEAIHRLFDNLRQTYDYVIVDLPPLSPLVDVRVTAPLIDCYVLAVEWGRTNIDVVKHALHTAPTISDSLIGAILNKTDIKAMTRYDAGRRDYYNDSHYVRYGFSDS
ncbi:AAA family ATPase [Bradyrhizobium sp. CCBAU 25338]|jgi:succinoglycan biosynthesis transport protein ExoP|uniref:AAA family ATPase n=1 Tax=Bradyrhizobium sp. CCBAU 25338 TaxID=1641877 RepID=UPI0023040BEC|nr:AAA family ATPase [Bradyrhizobium sp. CCBAU 25338]